MNLTIKKIILLGSFIISLLLLLDFERAQKINTLQKQNSCRIYQTAMDVFSRIAAQHKEPTTFVVWGAALNECIVLTDLKRKNDSKGLRIIRLGWPQYTPIFKENLNRLGIEYSTPGLFKEKHLYFVCDYRKLELLSAYTKEKFGFSVAYTLKYSIENLKIFEAKKQI